MGRRRRKRRYRFKKRFFVMLALLIVFVVAGSVLLFRSCAGEGGGEKPSSGAKETILAETADAGEGYLDRIVFIGDSRTVGLGDGEGGYGYIPSSRVFAEESLNHVDARKKKFVTLDGKKVTLTAAVTAAQPKIMIVAFGINGLGSVKEDEYMREYKGLVGDLKKAAPDSAVVIQSIYPVSKAVDVQQPASNNAVIKAYNQKLLDLAREEECYFLDTAQCLADKDGNLNEDLGAPDGIHIGPSGYEAILQYVRTHAVPGQATGAAVKSSSSSLPEDSSGSSDSSDSPDSGGASDESGSSDSSGGDGSSDSSDSAA